MEDRATSPSGFYRRRRGVGGRKLALDLLPEERMVGLRQAETLPICQFMLILSLVTSNYCSETERI